MMEPTLTIYFDNDTMTEVDAAKAIHILSTFLGVKLEIVSVKPSTLGQEVVD